MYWTLALVLIPGLLSCALPWPGFLSLSLRFALACFLGLALAVVSWAFPCMRFNVGFWV
tara:strand:- start:257 stop:433 length:177 start_codon:yes stop_codon:yes gene_type:complete